MTRTSAAIASQRHAAFAASLRRKLDGTGSVNHIRKELILGALREWGEPMSKAELRELFPEFPAWCWSSDQSPLHHLICEGRVARTGRRGARYYADPDLALELTRPLSKGEYR